MRWAAFIILLAFISCGRQNPAEQIAKLPGYWEIASVKGTHSEEKQFKISTVIDFIQVDNMSGVRTKVSPNLDGSFKTNGSAEKFTLKIEEDSLRLYYMTPFASWKETVLIAEDSLLKVKNEFNIVFTYKKFKKFNFKLD